MNFGQICHRSWETTYFVVFLKKRYTELCKFQNRTAIYGLNRVIALVTVLPLTEL